jgi:uridine nucleosidase
MTNIALFVSVHPELMEAVEQFVFMGGGVGLGNRSAVAGMLFYFEIYP